MVTVKQLMKALEGMPEDAEVRWLIESENPIDESWEMANIIFINDVFGKKRKVILTDSELKNF